MDGLRIKKTIFTSCGVLVAGLLSYSLVSLFFLPVLSSRQRIFEEKRRTLAAFQELVSRKSEYESAWASKKVFFTQGIPAEESLNAWIKELLAYGESRQLRFTKLEPQGEKVQAKEKGKKMRLFLAFEGDILSLVRFLHHLHEKDPLAGIESFSMKQEGEKRNFVYELTLGKVLA